MQHDAGPAARSDHRIRRRYGEGALAVRGPDKRRVRTRAAGNNLDAFRDHEDGIEADAEAADQRRFLAALRRLDAIEEGFGAGARDGAQRLDHLIAAHADAVVLD